MSTTLRVNRTYPHPRALVWRALVDRDLLAQWLMPNDFEPKIGHRFTFRTEPGPPALTASSAARSWRSSIKSGWS
ncbi:MAG: hypothetical protein BroJett001_32680 [Chloroflexota bacterium]|nr:MAG: hypothetical protein BroJett001_32680 [Chloroflexota bacterium]